ncbi:MAG: Gfo/Idh/MocA family protein [Terriglobia bacterium]
MTDTNRVGYLVVGLGKIAENAMLPAFRHSRKSRLIGVVSRDRRKARRFAKQFGAPRYWAYDEYEDGLRDPEVEAVYLATPNGAHVRETLQAARAGKHVLCEKPMANSAADCKRMIAACEAGGVRLMIAYRKYLEPASLALKKLVDSGRLGKLRLIHSAFTIFLPKGPSVPAWHFDPGLSGGGSLMDLGVYCVNTALWLAGEAPVSAEAWSWTADPARFTEEIEESIAFRLTFPGGLVMQGTSSFGAAQASFIQVHGVQGWAALNPAYAYDEERRWFGKIRGRWFEKVFPRMDEFALELDYFSACIRRQREPEPDGRSGLRDVQVMEAIYRAARSRKIVRIAPA